MERSHHTDDKPGALHNTLLAHHEPGNEHCPHCDRLDLVFPIRCNCGGLIHRQGDADCDSAERYVEICDICGARNAEYSVIIADL